MKFPRGALAHDTDQQFARTPNITNSLSLDRAIHANPNRDLPDRLALYAGLPAPTRAYGPRTAYDGYDGYSGDE